MAIAGCLPSVNDGMGACAAHQRSPCAAPPGKEVDHDQRDTRAQRDRRLRQASDGRCAHRPRRDLRAVARTRSYHGVRQPWVDRADLPAEFPGGLHLRVSPAGGVGAGNRRRVRSVDGKARAGQYPHGCWDG
jgi:hypothetical protein